MLSYQIIGYQVARHFILSICKHGVACQLQRAVGKLVQDDIAFANVELLWFLGGAAASVQGWAGEVLAYISPLNHIESFAKGILSVPDTIYYGSLAFLFLFFTYRMVEAQRWG